MENDKVDDAEQHEHARGIMLHLLDVDADQVVFEVLRESGDMLRALLVEAEDAAAYHRGIVARIELVQRLLVGRLVKEGRAQD
jgi:hypothetical protein